MTRQSKIIVAVTAIVLAFGLSHSLKGYWEIANLVLMGLAILYLLAQMARVHKNKEDS